MLSISNASLLMGLRETLRDNDFKIVDGFFGSRFSRDRRYRVFAMCGTNNVTYGTIGGHEFVITVFKRDENRKPIACELALCDSHLHSSDVWRTCVYKYPNEVYLNASD